MPLQTLVGAFFQASTRRNGGNATDGTENRLHRSAKLLQMDAEENGGHRPAKIQELDKTENRH